jgi:DNA polymerase III gamma/tau subunit
VDEQDVLSIFGFASVDDVAALAGHILSGDAAAALDLVAAQSAAGKDLGRLLSDLVAMSRDLLVSEVTGKESSGRRGELVSPLRGRFTPRKLTELLEILSAAEAGLRYSADKKLPLELAVIKGIQLLHTADLDEVLDTLAGLRGGEVLPARPVARAAAPSPSPATVAKPAERKSAPVAVAKSADPQKVWQEVVAAVAERYAIRSAWLERTQDVHEEDGVLRVVFPSDQEKLLKTPVVKEHGALIEDLWMKATGRKISFRPEATGKVVTSAPRAGSATPLADDFENDPGIEAAIELFGATLEPEEATKS